jgi:hypothetical protein
VLAQPLWEPPKLGDGERLGRYLGDHAQLVERADGEAPSVIDSLLPLRARNDSGNKRPIDIELEDRGEGFAPENAIVDTRLPREAGEGVAFQKSDVRIRPLARDRDYLCSRDDVGGGDPDTALVRDEVSQRCTHRRPAYDEYEQAASRSRDPYANPPAPDTVPNDLPPPPPSP